MTYDQPVLSLDIFKTITELANAPVNPEIPLDGVNLIPYLTGQKTGVPHNTIYMRTSERGAFALRSGEYKLIVPGTGQAAELYNLAKDISEVKNLAARKPEVLQALQIDGATWTRQMMAPDSVGIAETNEPQPIDTDTRKLKTGPGAFPKNIE